MSTLHFTIVLQIGKVRSRELDLTEITSPSSQNQRVARWASNPRSVLLQIPGSQKLFSASVSSSQRSGNPTA